MKEISNELDSYFDYYLGRGVAYSRLELSGFPTTIRLTLDDPGLVAPKNTAGSPAGPWSWEARQLVAAAVSFQRRHPGDGAFRVDQLEVTRIVGSSWQWNTVSRMRWK